jgi:hypothetical protein
MYQACQRLDVIDGGVEEDVKEVLRGHVWMTMTNGLRVLLSEKAWRLQPLAMPCPWREGGRTMTVEDKKEMLHNSFASHPVSQGHVWEELKKEILEELGGEMGCWVRERLQGRLIA